MTRKRDDGRYRESFRYKGKRYYVYGFSLSDVRNKIRDKIEELERGEVSLKNPALNDYYEIFTNIRRQELRESTLRAQRYQFDNIANVEMVNGKKFGELRIRDITRHDIEMARQILLDAGKTPENLNICFAHLNHVFNCAVIDETIPRNPCKSLKKLRRKKDVIGENRHRALTIEETKKFFEVSAKRDSYYHNIFMIMIKTGMRLGEATALYPADIDQYKGFIHIRRSVMRDEVGGYGIGDSAKTKSGVRDIPLTKEVYKILEDQKNQNKGYFGASEDGLIFRSTSNGIVREYTLNREIKRICEEAGIEYFTCHAFRNTFATRFIEQRPQDYKILSEILGHKDVSITLNLYTHVMIDNKVNAMNEINILT